MDKYKKLTLLPWLMWFIAALFYCYEFLLRVMPSAMMPYLSSFYRVDINGLSFILSAYYLAYTPLQVFVGTLMDLYGVRRLLTMAVFFCALGACIFGLYPNLLVGFIGRFLIGCGSAFAFVSVLKVASDWLPHKYFAILSGLTTSMGMIGAIAGEVAVTYLFDLYSVKTCLYASFLIAFIIMLLVYSIIKDRVEPKRKGAKVVLSKEVGKLLFIIKQVITNKQVLRIGLLGLFMYAPSAIFSDLWGITYLQKLYQFSPAKAAFYSSLVYVGWILGGPFFGFLSDKIHLRRLPMQAASICAFFISLIFLYMPNLPLFSIPILLVFIGFFSSAQVLSFAYAVDFCSPTHSGTAIAVTNMLVMCSFFLQILTGEIFR